MTPETRTRWPLVVMATLAGVIAAMQVGKVPPAIPVLRENLGLGLVTAGWVASVFNANSALLGSGAGILADRLGHLRAALGGLLLLAAGGALGGLAPSGAVLLLARWFEGLGFLAVVVTGPSLIVGLAAPRHYRLALGLWSAYMPAGIAFMMLLSPLLLARVGWRGLWFGNAVVVVIFAVLFRAVMRRTPAPPPRQRSWRDVRACVSRPGPWLLAASFACYSLQFFALMSWLPTFLVEELGATLSLAATLTALVVASNVIGTLGGGWLLHRGVPRWVLLAVVAGTLSFLAVGVFSGPFPVAVKLGLAFLFSALGGMLPAGCLAGAPVHAPTPALVGTVTGIIVQGANLGSLLGPPAMATAVEHLGGWHHASWLLLFAGAAGVVLSLALRRVERALPAAAD